MTKPCLAVLALLAAACGDDPVSYSEPVGLKLSIQSGDVENGVILDEKNINTESGNPYGAFVGAAEAAVGGSPSRIAVESATLALDATSSGVDGLLEIFDRDIDLRFIMNGSTSPYGVGTLAFADNVGAGPVALNVTFDSDDTSPDDYADLVGGSFTVELSGAAAEGFADLRADADLSLVLTFTAYE